MGHIFISYSHKDTDYAHGLANNLQSIGFEIWIDERLDYGSQWPQEIQKQLDTCDAFIIIMTPRSFASEWVQSELQRAKRKLKPIFPLLLEGDEPWLSVESTQYYDVRNGQMPDSRFFLAVGQIMSTPQSHEAYVPLPKSTINKDPVGERTKPEPKIRTEVLVSVIGLVGTIIAGFLASPLIEKWGGNKENPSATAAITTVQITDTSMIAAQVFTPVVSPGDVVDPKGVVMAYVPAGKFTMGSDNGDEDEKPSHEVYLDAYYIDKYELTNSLYKVCVDTGICKLPSDVRHFDDPKYVNHPVRYVDWQMAQTYCEWRGTRLPTEAEWEKAARGINDRIYPWGDTASCEQSNYGDCVGETTEVGKYKSGASPYGVYDMGGNVWEWVMDWYLSDYYKILGNNSSNPQGPTTGNERVIRGGRWDSTFTKIRSSNRGSENSFTEGVGFRCARPETISATATVVVTLTASAAELNLPASIFDSKKVAMVLVPSGEFTMGTDIENASSSEKPAHKVYLSVYYIDKYEVTNTLYKACVDAGVCDSLKYINSRTRDSYFGNSDFNNYPVVYVNWFMAEAYCKWRGARLPTEAEWEKAARGTDERTFPWGEENSKTFANFNLYIGDTVAVGSYADGSSIYGVHDMAGNVWEWVADWYADGYYKVSLFENPSGPELGNKRVFRGGAFYIAPESIETFTRSADDPGNLYDSIGFRCAKDAAP